MNDRRCRNCAFGKEMDGYTACSNPQRLDDAPDLFPWMPELRPAFRMQNHEDSCELWRVRLVVEVEE